MSWIPSCSSLRPIYLRNGFLFGVHGVFKTVREELFVPTESERQLETLFLSVCLLWADWSSDSPVFLVESYFCADRVGMGSRNSSLVALSGVSVGDANFRHFRH